MKKIATYFFLLLPFQAWCQFHEKFDDNRNQWFIENGDAYSRKIESGKYVLETFNEGHGQFTNMPWRFDPTRDFAMEISFVQKSGSINNGIGLYWGKVSRMNNFYNEFVITTNGYYKTGVFGHDDWVQTDKIRPLGETNTLRVEKRGRTLSYFLNDKMLTTWPG
jgi:hypothetical protein